MLEAHDDVKIKDEPETATDEAILDEELLQAFLEPDSSQDCTTARQLDMFLPANEGKDAQDRDTKKKKLECCHKPEPPTVKKRKRQRTTPIKVEDETPDSTLSDYELQRLQNIKRNKAIMEKLGINSIGFGSR